MTRFEELVQIVARLRGEGGCAWDRAQTPASMRPYLLEEAHEVLAAVDLDRPEDVRREIGDLVFTLLLVARMYEERGAFTVDQALASVAAKMVRRHPHVFDPAHTSTGDEGTLPSWEARKAAERGGAPGSALDGVPASLPALLRAHRISEKAARVGFDWPDREGVRDKVAEELAELDRALETGDEQAIAEEFGDLLFALVNLGRFLPTTAEDALRGATRKFEVRFRRLEERLRAQGRSVHTLDLDALEGEWRRVKEGG